MQHGVMPKPTFSTSICRLAVINCVAFRQTISAVVVLSNYYPPVLHRHLDENWAVSEGMAFFAQHALVEVLGTHFDLKVDRCLLTVEVSKK